MSKARSTHKRLYKLLDEIKAKQGHDRAARMDLFVHIVLGFHELVGFVNCDECGPVATDIANALIEKTTALMGNEGIDGHEFKACFEAAKEDYAEFEAANKAAEKETKDVLSRASSGTKH